jgi:hypothetical protein
MAENGANSTFAFTILPTGPGTPLFSRAEVEAVCPGGPAAPTAEPGAMCVYRSEGSSAAVTFGSAEARAATPFGAVVPFRAGPAAVETDAAFGSWAVTAK